MAKKKVAKKGLKMRRRIPVDDPWRYTYCIVGDKKIGKTSLAIEDAEEFVFQLDRPQLAYPIREEYINSYKKLMQVTDQLEEQLEAQQADKYKGDEIDRIVVDDIGKVWKLTTDRCLKHFQIEHPSDEGFAKAWHWIRDRFLEWIDRLLEFKVNYGVGVVFITHSEWKEIKSRKGGETQEKIKADLASRCEKILEGKVDMWAVYDWYGDQRVLVIIGDETTNAGHSIDGHFLTKDGERVREIPMGDSAEEAHANFLKAFNNEQKYPTLRAAKVAAKGRAAKKKRRGKKK